jgi:hypothetical protein
VWNHWKFGDLQTQWKLKKRFSESLSRIQTDWKPTAQNAIIIIH